MQLSKLLAIWDCFVERAQEIFVERNGARTSPNDALGNLVYEAHVCSKDPIIHVLDLIGTKYARIRNACRLGEPCDDDMWDMLNYLVLLTALRDKEAPIQEKED